MAEISRAHPRLPFITLHIDRPTAAEIAEAEESWRASDDSEPYFEPPHLKAWAMNGAWEVGYSSALDERDDDERIFLRLAQRVESDFFSERDGAYLHLRVKAQEAAEAGDLELLCLLAEGFGFWRGAHEAHDRASQYFASILNPVGGRYAAEPLSFFDKLADPPTILADYHEQEKRRRAKAIAPGGEDEPF